MVRDGEYAYCVACAWQTHPVRKPNREFDHDRSTCDDCEPDANVTFRHYETAEAHRMQALGYALVDIAHNLHVSKRTIQRYLARPVTCGFDMPLCARCKE